MTQKFTYDYVKDLFEKQNCELLSKEYLNSSTKLKYKCSCGNISEILLHCFIGGARCQQCGYDKLRKYKVKSDYFQTIDNKNKAYILGYIFADGSIKKNLRTLELVTSKDIDLLEFLRKELRTTAPIKYYAYKYKDKIYDKYKVAIHSNIISADLIRLHILPNKTYLTCVPPKDQIPSKLLPQFLLGVFDGDGSVGIYMKNDGYKSQSPSWNITSLHKETLSNLQDLCNMHIGIIRKNSGAHCHKWYLNNQREFIEMYHYLYDDPPDFFLLRKKLNFDKIISHINREHKWVRVCNK